MKELIEARNCLVGTRFLPKPVGTKVKIPFHREKCHSFFFSIMQGTIHFFESSHFCSSHANLLYSHLATQLLLLLLWSLLRRACSRETSGCLLQRTLRLARLHTHSIDIRYTLPVIASYVPPRPSKKKKTSEEEQPNQKFPHALYNYQNYATCRNLPPTHLIGENMPQLCLGEDDFLMVF